MTFPYGLYDSSTDTLYGADTTTNSLYTVNRATGAYTLVGATGTTNPTGLAFIP